MNVHNFLQFQEKCLLQHAFYILVCQPIDETKNDFTPTYLDPILQVLHVFREKMINAQFLWAYTIS